MVEINFAMQFCAKGQVFAFSGPHKMMHDLNVHYNTSDPAGMAESLKQLMICK